MTTKRNLSRLSRAALGGLLSVGLCACGLVVDLEPDLEPEDSNGDTAGPDVESPPYQVLIEEATCGTTFDPTYAQKNLRFRGGNLIVDGGIDSFSDTAYATHGHASGRHYFEVNLLDVSAGSAAVSVSQGSEVEAWPELTVAGCSVTEGALHCGNDDDAAKPFLDVDASFSRGGVIGVAFDVDAGKVFFHQNGVWLGDQDPALDNGLSIGTLRNNERGLMASVTLDEGQSVSLNVGGPFAYAPPAGFAPYDNDCAE